MIHAFTCCIHGNLPALDAVLADIDGAGIDRLWCLGDIVGYGADPQPCIQRLREREATCLRGNHEQALFDDGTLERFNRNSGNAIWYSRGAIDVDSRAWLASLPDEHVAEGFHLAHASTAGDHISLYVLGDQAVEEAFAAAGRELVFIGHTHCAAVAWREEGEVRHSTEPSHRFEAGRPMLVNVGSVGQPRDGDNRASWVRYDDVTGAIEFRRVAYDIEAAQSRFLAVGLPPYLSERLQTAK